MRGEQAGVYIGRQEYFERLDAHAAGGGPPLVVLGESGSGKSALLANWALAYRGRHPEELLLVHFIGATPASADWTAMLRRILGELNRRFGLGIEIPDKPDALRAAFANALHMAAARGRVILILDALNQLEDRDQAPDLVWLPPVIPEDVRLIVSTLPGRSLDDLARRGWPALTVQPLAAGERRELIEQYLGQYRKELSEARAERVAAAPQTANPLYLRALLEELRLFGVHETLDECISDYLAAATVDELYERILARYEEDYEGERPGLVRDAMSLLWAARRGLSEAELLDLLGDDGTPLPRAHWSPLYLAAEASLVNRSGLIGFFHDYLRQAVEGRYLPTEEDRRQAHLRLADYFGRRSLGRGRSTSCRGSWRRPRPGSGSTTSWPTCRSSMRPGRRTSSRSRRTGRRSRPALHCDSSTPTGRFWRTRRRMRQTRCGGSRGLLATPVTPRRRSLCAPGWSSTTGRRATARISPAASATRR